MFTPWIAAKMTIAHTGTSILITTPSFSIDPRSPSIRLLYPWSPCWDVSEPLRIANQAISTATSGRHGGNMDYRGIVAGVTVYLPVFVEGALFHLGDGHAAQADGEILGRGIEVSMDVTFTVDVIKKAVPSGPEEKTRMRSSHWEMPDLLIRLCSMPPRRCCAGCRPSAALMPPAPIMLLGQFVRYEIGNVFDPAYTTPWSVNRPRRSCHDAGHDRGSY